MKVSIIIEKDEYEYYAFSPELKGCHTQGDSLEEVLENIKEAVEFYLETLSSQEKEYCLSKEIFTTSMGYAEGTYSTYLPKHRKENPEAIKNILNDYLVGNTGSMSVK